MLARYVLSDLLRNPRRTLSTMVGVVLGVGLFCGVLFYVDGLSASMTQRAVAPLPLDMQRIFSERAGATLDVRQRFDGPTSMEAGDRATVILSVINSGETPANEATVRSLPAARLAVVRGSAEIDGRLIDSRSVNPFSQGPGKTGYNLGSLEPGERHRLTYRVEATGPVALDDSSVRTSYSSRESVAPTDANRPPPTGLADLAVQIAGRPGVAAATELSIADLGPESLDGPDGTAAGPAKIFGFDAAHAERDDTIDLIEGSLRARGAVLSVEAARATGAGVGESVTVALPDGARLDLPVTGVADLSRARSLFSSRRGGDLETFIYVPNAVVVSPARFAGDVFPAFEKAAASGTGRLKSPPIREIDISLDRALLDSDPATARGQTERIATDVMAVAAQQDYLLDNISNTLTVASADANVAKKLFVFLGLPGALLAAMLAAYGGNVLAESQRRESATLRIRGASRGHLVRMLALRTALITASGALLGLVAGYAAATLILGQGSIARASTASLATSAIVGTLAGFGATGLALYLTGRRSIDREINEDRARLDRRPPLWRRARLDLVALLVLVGGTAWAVATNAFDGAAGSVYFGRGVELNLLLLVLPVAVWLAGSLAAARLAGIVLVRARPASSPHIGRPMAGLLRRSVGRRPWAVANAAIIVSLIVALATSLAAFTASYDAAKIDDARYANGADIRVTPSPTSDRRYGAADAEAFETPGIARATPVIYGLSNVVLRSERTSDPANLVAIDPAAYPAVAPLDARTGAAIRELDPSAGSLLVSREMADFLQAEPGDTLNVLLARATVDQVDVALTIGGVFERLPGFPDGADAVMTIDAHTAAVPGKAPDFFLAAAAGSGSSGLQRAVGGLRAGPAAADRLQIDTRATTLDRDQSSLAALNVAGLVHLDSAFALAMAGVTIGIFVFGLLLQRRREYIVLRAQGLDPGTVRALIAFEAGIVALAGSLIGVVVGAAMGFYFVNVLRPLFVLDPGYTLPPQSLALPVGLVLAAAFVASVIGSRLVNGLEPTELLRDE